MTGHSFGAAPTGFSLAPYLTQQRDLLVIGRDRMDDDGNLHTLVIKTIGPVDALRCRAQWRVLSRYRNLGCLHFLLTDLMTNSSYAISPADVQCFPECSLSPSARHELASSLTRILGTDARGTDIAVQRLAQLCGCDLLLKQSLPSARPCADTLPSNPTRTEAEEVELQFLEALTADPPATSSQQPDQRLEARCAALLQAKSEAELEVSTVGV